MIPIQVPPRVDLAEAHLAGKKLDNPCTTLITCIMLARQITLPQRQLLCFLLHPCKPSNFMQLRTLLRNGASLSLLFSMASALFLSPRGCTLCHPQRSDVRTFKRANSFVYKSLPPLCRLFALFSALAAFVFNRLQPLFPKHPSGGQQVRSQVPYGGSF